MNKKLLGIGVALLIVGVVLLAAMIYQEKVAPPTEEDYHMEIPPTAKYEWRTRNLAITLTGLGFIVVGVCFIFVAMKKKF